MFPLWDSTGSSWGDRDGRSPGRRLMRPPGVPTRSAVLTGAVVLAAALASPVLPTPTLSAPAPAQSVGLPSIPEVDSKAAHEVEWRLYLYYIFGGRTLHFSPYDGFCDADLGNLCFGQDWESSCRAFLCQSHEEMAEFVEKLAKLAREHPDSPYAFGQAVYAAVRLDQPRVADSLTAPCVDRTEWWCHMARGYVLHRGGRSGEAEAHLRRGLEGAPDDLRCRLEDVYPLLRGETRDTYDALPCDGRDEVHRHVWWLSDPFFMEAGNERWAEHVSRRFELLFHEHIIRVRSARGSLITHTQRHERSRVMRGPPDSWRGTMREAGYVSRRGAANHFVPETLSLDGLDGTLEYRLEAEREDEGYTRHDGRTEALPAQVARFRKAAAGGSSDGVGDGVEGDTMVVAFASELGDVGEREVGQAFFVASEGRDHAASLPPVPLRETVTYAADLPGRIQLVGVEVFTPEGTARHRRVVEPLEAGERGMSDLLLFRPIGPDLPETRMRAIGLMHGSLRVRADRTLGVYWEAYGIDPDTEVDFTVRLEEDAGGVLNWLGRAIGAGGEERGAITWTETASRNHAITLQLDGLDDGEYDLLVEMGLPDGTVLSRSVRMEVVDG